MMIEAFCFSTISTSSISGGAQSSDIYRNISIFNITMWLIFNMVDVIFKLVSFFSTIIKYTYIQV